MKTDSRKNSKRYVGALLVTFCALLVILSAMSVQSKVIEEIIGERNGTICGTVTDSETNKPIPDALLTLEYHDTIRTEHTDSQGKYFFRNVPMCFCLKNLSASKEGYESAYKMVAVYKVTHVDFELKPTNGGGEPIEGVLTGYVTDSETGDPIPNALMTLKYHEVIRTQFTDINGHYSFEGVPICFCLKNISAYKEGYVGQSQLIAMSELTYANFSLEPETDDQKPTSCIPTNEANELENKIESKKYQYIAFGLIGTFVVLIIGLTIFTTRKRA